MGEKTQGLVPDDRTKVMIPASLRNVAENWAQIYGNEYEKQSFVPEKKKNLALTLYHLNPSGRKIFTITIPDHGALRLGTESFESISKVPSKKIDIDWVSIDPGRKLDGFGMIIWRSPDTERINWMSKGVFLRNENEWESIEDFRINYVQKKSNIRGIIGPWWGFVIKGY